MQSKSKYSCEEHLDRAFDDFLVEYETFPELGKCSEGNCDFCGKKSAYILSGKKLENV